MSKLAKIMVNALNLYEHRQLSLSHFKSSLITKICKRAHYSAISQLSLIKTLNHALGFPPNPHMEKDISLHSFTYEFTILHNHKRIGY